MSERTFTGRFKGFLRSLQGAACPELSVLSLGDVTIDVVRKNIRHVHLRVCAPSGRVRISAPVRMDSAIIKAFAVSKLNWIKKHRQRFRTQVRAVPPRYVTHEQHCFLGTSFSLQVVEHDAPPTVNLVNDTLVLRVRAHTGHAKRRALLDRWYRHQLKELVHPMIARYEPIMRVQVSEIGIKQMRTRWGTCNRAKSRIWLNLALAKRPVAHIEYVVVHEMVHLLERGHTKRFAALMDQFLPAWRSCKVGLNAQPLESY